MTFVITKTINGKFTYWWNKNTERWEGLRDNASGFEAGQEVNSAIATIRRKLMYDDSVRTVIGRRILKVKSNSDVSDKSL